MKKVLIILILCFTLAACSTKAPESVKTSATCDESGVWISYSELNTMLLSEQGFKVEFQEVIENLQSLKIQNLYIHVRPFCDSLYKSDYFPLMPNVKSYDYDVFEYVINECHANGIKVHAWINPYRVSNSTTDIETIDSTSPAYKWLKDDIADNDRNVCLQDGIYLNPAETEVQSLIINGIKEILQNYSVDGIHFDDYFYPTCDTSFDEVSYSEYLNKTETPLSLEDWRRNSVNALISGCYSAIKYINKDVIFSVSPTASIEKNYNNLYADVKEWVNGGYIDYIIPQLYFGFEYPDRDFRFENLLSYWKEVVKESDVGLIIGLGFYKSIPELQEDRQEWENNHDIIARQVEICKQDGTVQGYVFFSYSSLFGQDSAYTKQRENILKLENVNG